MTDIPASTDGSVCAFNDQYTDASQLSVRATSASLPVYTDDQIANQLASAYWSGDFHHWNVRQGGTITVNLTALTSAGQSLARAALGEWSDIIGVRFAEVTSGGQIVFDDTQSGAFTNTGWTNHILTSAQVNISTQWLSDYGTGLNTYSFQTYIHEIGHALGLGHGGNYDGNADYPTDALYANDCWSTTVMSYFSQQDNTYFANKGFTYNFAETPMAADILAMRTLYGLSTTTRTGNTTYGFNSTAVRPIFDASLYSNVAYTIFDNGGVDTLNYSGFSANQVINLNSGTFSNVGGRIGNVGIARGTVIENATGGSGADTLIGNAANNVLNGGIGADKMSGGAGNDTYVVDNIGDRANESAGAGTDGVTSSVNFTLSANVENLTLTGSANINGTGNASNNVITGNAASNVLTGGDGNDTLGAGAGNDTLHGGIGVDTLDGGRGADSMDGGDGNDTYVVDNLLDSVIEANASGGIDLVKSSIAFTLGANFENLTLLGSLPIDGTGNALANVITGNSGSNVLRGLNGNDSLSGGSGDDTLYGGSGNDVLNGGSGNDLLYGSSGNDSITGGGGADMFRFDSALSASSNVDRIADFSVIDDTIVLDEDIFTSVGAVGALSARAFFAGAAAHDGDDRIIYDATTGNIYYDADGNGAGAALLFAHVTPGLALTIADFNIVG